MLPGVDGFEILASVREHKDTPILMLTARDAVEDACAGWKAAPTTTWSSPSPFPNSSRGCRRCCAVAARKSLLSCAWPAWNWTWPDAAPSATAAAWT